jgi:hypothetical protein
MTLLMIDVQGKVDSFNMETIFLFQFGEGPDADKIVSLTEFVDGKRYPGLKTIAPVST